MNALEPIRPVERVQASEPLLITVREHWAVIIRRKWLVLASIVLGVTVAGIISTTLPKSYRSSTLIMIETQKVPDEYVKGIGGASIGERLAMIQQQVMSRTLMSQIVETFELYGEQPTSEAIEAAIEGMKKAVKVERVGATGGMGKSMEAVTISFSHGNPKTAMDVTAKLASHFIEQNTKGREEVVRGTSVFLEQELQAAKEILEKQEKVISQFKATHIGLLPEQMEANLRSLDRLQINLTAADEMLRSLADRLSLVEKSIKDYDARGTDNSAPGQSATHTGVDPAVARLRDLEKHLTSLRAQYTEIYPDIGEAKKEIESLKRQLVEKYGSSSMDNTGAPVKVFDPYLRELIKQRDELQQEFGAVKDRRQKLAVQIKQLESRVEQTPTREQELMILIRDYKSMQENYQSLLEKRLNIRVAEKLEKNEQSEQFRIVDPANLPLKPEKQNRLQVMLLGLLGGCGLGVGFALGLDQLNPTFKRREEIERLPGVRLLATIPDFFSLYHNPSLTFAGKNPTNGETHSGLPSVVAGWRYPSWTISGSRQQTLRPCLNLVSKWQPRSIPAEQYRMAATRLAMSSETRGSTVIGVTSALKGEGKTTTVVNLGYTLARDLGKRTLLIDCDFRCPALQQYVNVSAPAGLIELLDGEAPLEDCVFAIDDIPCSILPLGGTHHEHNELVRIQQVKEILPRLRMDYDYVILNTPPVLPSATMGVLSGMAEIMIVVIRANSTPKPAVEQALKMLGQKVDTLAVLNRVENASMPHYMYGYAMSYGEERTAETVSK